MRYSLRVPAQWLGVVMVCLALGLTGCALFQGGNTPRQQAFSLNAKWIALQPTVHTAVTTPGLPADVKSYIQAASHAVSDAATAYTQAVEQGQPNAATLLPIGLGKILDMANYLVDHGFMTQMQTTNLMAGLPKPYAVQTVGPQHVMLTIINPNQ